jgi:hypothetical protein
MAGNEKQQWTSRQHETPSSTGLRLFRRGPKKVFLLSIGRMFGQQILDDLIAGQRRRRSNKRSQRIFWRTFPKRGESVGSNWKRHLCLHFSLAFLEPRRGCNRISQDWYSLASCILNRSKDNRIASPARAPRVCASVVK